VSSALLGAWLPAAFRAYGYEKTALADGVSQDEAVAYSSHVDESVPNCPYVGDTRMFPMIEVELTE